MAKRARPFYVKLLIAVMLAVFLLVFNFPIINTFLTSLKSNTDISSRPPKWLFHPTLDHYQNVLFGYGYDFPQFFLNSIVISLGASLLTIALCFPAAYSIVRFRTGGGNPLFFVMSLRLIPPIVFLIPLFIVYRYLQLYDSQLGLIFMNTLINTPLGLLLFVGFIQDVPRELEEAAMIDGASAFTLLRCIVFPLIFPGMVAVTILVFIFSWNEFFMSLILSLTEATPVTVGASLFVTAWEIRWGEIAAAITISVIPTLIFIFFIQRYLVRAFTGGALK